MKKIIRSLSVLLSIVMVFALAGCTSSSETKKKTTKEQKPVTLTISAAASLKDSMDEIKKLYAKEKPNVTLNINYGSSGTLEQQIEQGADVDLFMSAATKQMDALSKKGLLLEDTKANLLGNTVVLVVKKDSSLSINNFNDLATDKVKKVALGEASTVPAGQYAQEILTTLNILDKVKTKAVYGKDVKEVLNWVETGNADAGIVYGTDAKASTKVKVIATASSDLYKTPVVYPVSVIKASKNTADTKEFLKFISSSKGKAVFVKCGFEFLVK